MRLCYCIRILLYFIVYSLSFCNGHVLDDWPSLSENMIAAVRAQRDLSDVITVDQLTGFGVSLNSMVFDKYGYTSTTSSNISSILYVGARVLTMDVYWNEFTSVWQLCPGPYPSNSSTNATKARDVKWDNKTYFCQPDFNIDTVINQISHYFQTTNSNLDVNSLHLILNIKSIRYPKNNSNHRELHDAYQVGPLSHLGNSTLNDTFTNIQNLIYTPIDLLNYKKQLSTDFYFRTQYNGSDSNFPSLETFLYQDIKRATIALNLNDYHNDTSRAYNFTNNDYSLFFFNNDDFSSMVISTDDEIFLQDCNSLSSQIQNIEQSEQAFEEITNKTQFRFVIDHDDNPFTNQSFREFMKCGFGPILNASEYQIGDDKSNSLGVIMNYFTNMSLWLWLPGQPKELSSHHWNETDVSEVAYRCGALNNTGVVLANCYEEYRYACQKNDSPYEWKIDRRANKSYFRASDDDSCPDGYSLGVPLSSLQILSLYDAIEREGASYPVWVDLNDITVENCFVRGGPYASCPYQRIYTKSKLIGLIAPGFFVSLFLLSLITILKFARTNPIQTNRRRYWKKVIREYNARNEYEGVPS